MSCGCNSCPDCGSSNTSLVPRMNGTEVTVLSGLNNSSGETKENPASSNHGLYIVLGVAGILAALAYFKADK